MTGNLNFEGFKNLIVRVVREWYELAKRDHKFDMDIIKAYLQESPFTAKQTPENEEAYEKLMDTRMKLYVSKLCNKSVEFSNPSGPM